MSDLRIPVAIGPTGKYVLPEQGIKGTLYRCPDCHAELTFRAGQKNRKHFSHPAPTTPQGCSGGGEGLKHLETKLRLQLTLRAWIQQEKPITFQVQCIVGHRNLLQWNLRVSDEVRVEHPLAGRKLDVAILRDQLVGMALEVYVSHLVDEAKRQAIKDIWWVELDGNHDLTSLPFHPLNHNLPFECTECKRIQEEREKAETHRQEMQALREQQRREWEQRRVEKASARVQRADALSQWSPPVKPKSAPAPWVPEKPKVNIWTFMGERPHGVTVPGWEAFQKHPDFVMQHILNPEHRKAIVELLQQKQQEWPEDLLDLFKRAVCIFDDYDTRVRLEAVHPEKPPVPRVLCKKALFWWAWQHPVARVVLQHLAGGDRLLLEQHLMAPYGFPDPVTECVQRLDQELRKLLKSSSKKQKEHLQRVLQQKLPEPLVEEGWSLWLDWVTHT